MIQPFCSINFTVSNMYGSSADVIQSVAQLHPKNALLDWDLAILEAMSKLFVIFPSVIPESCL